MNMFEATNEYSFQQLRLYEVFARWRASGDSLPSPDRPTCHNVSLPWPVVTKIAWFRDDMSVINENWRDESILQLNVQHRDYLAQFKEKSVPSCIFLPR
jgi:hypothetical protein